MNIIDKYIIRAHIAPFLFGVFVVVFLFLLQFIIKFIDQLLGKGLSYWIVTQLIVLNIAWMVVLAVPIGVLFSTLLAFGSMSAAHEITIIKASGGSLIRMMAPLIILGAIISYLLFLFNDDVLPEANHRAKILMNDIQRKKPTFSLESGQFFTEMDGYVILSRKVDSLSGMLYGVTIYDNRQLMQQNIASSDSGRVRFNQDYSKLIVTLYKGEAHQLIPNNLSNYRIIHFDTYEVQIPASGYNFVQSSPGMMSRGDRELRIKDMRVISDNSKARMNEADRKISRELNKNLDFLKVRDKNAQARGIAEGSTAYEIITKGDSAAAVRKAIKRVNFLMATIQTDISQSLMYREQMDQYLVEIHKKYAIPFACLVFVFVGCPLGIITRGGNFGVSAAITLGFYILYWACLIGGEKLADRGMVSPLLSMWLGNIIIGILGIILTIKVNNESLNIFPGFVRHFFKRIISRA